MVAQLVFRYEDTSVKAMAPQPASVDAAMCIAASLLNIPKDSYDLYDKYGKIELAEDLQRAIHMAGNADVEIRVKEHHHFKRLRSLEEHKIGQDARLTRLEQIVAASSDSFAEQLEAAKQEILAKTSKLEKRIDSEVNPVLEALVRDRNRLDKEVRQHEETIGMLDVAEMKMIARETKQLKDEVQGAVSKVNAMQSSWITEKAKLTEMCVRSQQDLHELQRYMQGKIDVCIEADADLRREQQLVCERMQLVADDVRLQADEHSRLSRQCMVGLEESEELRTLLGHVREDHEKARAEMGQVKTRLNVLEGSALEKWEGFMPGVLYCRQWHRLAKGPDVQLNPDMDVATGRGFLSSTGMVIGNIEGLICADGPCRRFGTPGCYASYYELVVEEAKIVPSGMGGLWCGFALQTVQEISAHPGREFDGWLVGGSGKAMVCRAGTPPDLPDDPELLPGTLQPGGRQGSAVPGAQQAMLLLRRALPPRPIGDQREMSSSWDSQHLRAGDRLGVLFRCHRRAGATLRVSVNGAMVLEQSFPDAPGAEAVGFFTPVVRLAGAGKSVRLQPSVSPSAAMLASD